MVIAPVSQFDSGDNVNVLGELVLLPLCSKNSSMKFLLYLLMKHRSVLYHISLRILTIRYTGSNFNSAAGDGVLNTTLVR